MFSLTSKSSKGLKTGLLLALVPSLLGLGAVLPQSAFASCYGTGYSRYCDGIGGPGATYSPRGDFGSTTYSNGSSQTYSTYY